MIGTIKNWLRKRRLKERRTLAHAGRQFRKAAQRRLAARGHPHACCQVDGD